MKAMGIFAAAIGVLGGIVLMAAGIVMVRRGAHATLQALGMSAACLVAFALIAFVAPVMSGLAMVLGIGFPILLLAFLFWHRGRGSRLPGAA